MQSARRASEIHQERTGRALRVTENEVVNEEMYEEITDVSKDRRLWRADWNIRSDEFDRRLLAYFTGQPSTHGVSNETVSGSWKEQRPDSAALVNSDAMQTASFPQHAVDMTPRTLRHAPYPVGPWDTQPRDNYHALTTPFTEHNFNQQCMAPPQSPWWDDSRRMSLPTTFTPQTYHQSSSWTATPPSNCPSSPSQHLDSAIDQPNMPRPLQQPTPKGQNSILATGNLTDTHLPALPLANLQILPNSTIHNQAYYKTEKIPSSTASPKHNFTDRRYSYNPNGKFTTAPASSTQQISFSASSSSVPPTPLMSWNSSIQTPSPLQLSGSPDSAPFVALGKEALGFW